MKNSHTRAIAHFLFSLVLFQKILAINKIFQPYLIPFSLTVVLPDMKD